MSRKRSNTEPLIGDTSGETIFEIYGLVFFADSFSGCGYRGIFLVHMVKQPALHRFTQRVRPSIITEVYSDDGEVIGRFWEEKRVVVPIEDVSPHLIHAFVAAEDARFFEHEGVDIVGIVRALSKNLAAGKIEQGGSTITQQVTRSLLLKNTERTYRRKAREALLSMQIEKNFSKKRILFLYLNQIYLGRGSYGVEAAAQTYFNKSAKEINLAECALLAGLPQAPTRYSPVLHFDRARARQEYVLERMAEEGYITREQRIDALETPLNIQTTTENTFSKTPYFTEHVRRYLLEKYGRELLYRGGLKVHTTLNLGMQHAARDAIEKGLSELDKREGYRGPLRASDSRRNPCFQRESCRGIRFIAARSRVHCGRAGGGCKRQKEGSSNQNRRAIGPTAHVRDGMGQKTQSRHGLLQCEIEKALSSTENRRCGSCTY